MTKEAEGGARDRLRLALEGCLGGSLQGGNRVEVLRNGERAFPAMLAAIGAARRTIELATFVYWKGAIAERFADLLARKAREGVRVLVLLDAVGCLPMEPELVERMERGGAVVATFRPVHRWRFWRTPHRTHRKILVCDGEVGFTGGFGIAEEWEGDARGPDEWRDTHFRIQGPAVHGLQAAFCGNWLETGKAIDDAIARVRPLEPVGAARILTLRTTASLCWSDVGPLLELLIASARRRLRVTTPYFVPTARCVAQLEAAVARGVTVEVLIPGPHIDRRMSELAGAQEYGPLIEAGVKLFAYQPTMLHAKAITIDGEVAMIGSANFNQRSMSQDDEICLVVADDELVATLDEDFERDLERSELVDLERWKSRGPFRRCVEACARVFRSQA